MITEQDLKQAIAECQGVQRPNANTCMKLAAFYTIYNEMYGKDQEHTVLNEQVLNKSLPEYNSESEFWDKIRQKDFMEVIPIIDELMETLRLINPRLYNSVMQKL